jgi:hypothetical protein
MKMNKWVFIDVDLTLIDHDDRTRPNVKELIEKLRRLDCKIVIWSAGGHLYAEQKFDRICQDVNFNLRGYVHAYWWKAWQDKIVITAPRFYIDDEQSMLDARMREKHATFKVPKYNADLDLKQTDDWLLKAADAVEKWVSDLEN